MHESLEFTVYSKEYLNEMILLSKKSDSTDRDIETFTNNNLTGVIALSNNKIVGAIPMEPRTINIGEDNNLKILWVTGAHVDEKYRSQGIGAKLDSLIEQKFSKEYDGIFVYRGDEESRAYKWYVKQNFGPIADVLSYKKDIIKKSTNIKYKITSNTFNLVDSKLFSCIKKNNQNCYNLLRDENYWSHKINNHYYRESNAYHILTIDNSDSYAILAQTNSRDDINRFEILELVTKDKSTFDQLLECINHEADKNNLTEIRYQVSENFFLLDHMLKSEFKLRYQTKIMGKLFNSSLRLEEIPLNYHQIDYI